MPIQQLDLSRPLDAQTPLSTIASLSRQHAAQDQEAQLNAAHLQQIAMQLQESKKKLDEETAVKKIIADGGEPQDVYKKLLAVNPDTARTYLTNSQADTLQAQNQALLRAKTLEGQPAPEVPDTSPGNSLPAVGDQPAVPLGGTQVQNLPSVKVPFIGQPDATIQPQSQQQLTLAARAKAEFDARLDAQKKAAEGVIIPKGGMLHREGQPDVTGQPDESDIEKEANPWIKQNPVTNGHPSTLSDYVDHKSTLAASSSEYGQELAAFNKNPGMVKQFGQGPLGLSAKKQADQLKLHAGEAAQTAAAQNALQQGAVKNVAPHLVTPATEAYAKDSKAYVDAAQAADDMKSFIGDAKAGNKVAYSFLPAEGALYLTTARGVKRVNTTEMEAFGGGGSALDRIKAFLGKQASGESIPANILNDMDSLSQTVWQNAKTAYQRKVAVTNQAYGSTFQPMDFGGAPSAAASGIEVNPGTGQYRRKDGTGYEYSDNKGASWHK